MNLNAMRAMITECHERGEHALRDLLEQAAGEMLRQTIKDDATARRVGTYIEAPLRRPHDVVVPTWGRPHVIPSAPMSHGERVALAACLACLELAESDRYHARRLAPIPTARLARLVRDRDAVISMASNGLATPMDALRRIAAVMGRGWVGEAVERARWKPEDWRRRTVSTITSRHAGDRVAAPSAMIGGPDRETPGVSRLSTSELSDVASAAARAEAAANRATVDRMRREYLDGKCSKAQWLAALDLPLTAQACRRKCSPRLEVWPKRDHDSELLANSIRRENAASTTGDRAMVRAWPKDEDITTRRRTVKR